MFLARGRFYVPEELYCGRLDSHGEREVFESNLSDENEIACVSTCDLSSSDHLARSFVEA